MSPSGSRSRRCSSEREITERVGRALELVRLSDLGARMPHQLSGGQQQRVRPRPRDGRSTPRILLMDEPLSNLDAKLRIELREDIRDLQHFARHHHRLRDPRPGRGAGGLRQDLRDARRARCIRSARPGEVYKRPATLFVRRLRRCDEPARPAASSYGRADRG